MDKPVHRVDIDATATNVRGSLDVSGAYAVRALKNKWCPAPAGR